MENDDLPFGYPTAITTIDIQKIREIPTERNYWFVRTYGGKLFDYFYEMGRAGIAGNRVPLDLIKRGNKDHVSFNSLQTVVLNNLTEKNAGSATSLAKQLVNFYHNVNIGDIVMIPSENSDFIAFGKITSELKENKKIKDVFTHNDKVEEFPQRYRDVDWIKIMSKRDVIGDMRNLFSTQLGLTNADQYSSFIEGNISTFFQKNDYYYSAMFVDLNSDEELNAFELHRYLESITKLYKHYCIINNIEDNEELYLKIKIQSQGNNLWKWAKIGMGTGILGILAMSIAGSDPSLKFSESEGFEASLKGNFFENVSNFYEAISNTKHSNEEKEIELENRRIEQIVKKRDLGLLTDEEIDKYKIQLIDSAKSLQIKSIESKDVEYDEIK